MATTSREMGAYEEDQEGHRAAITIDYDDESGQVTTCRWSNACADHTVSMALTDPESGAPLSSTDRTLAPGTGETSADITDLNLTMVQETNPKTGLTGWAAPCGASVGTI